MNILAVVFSLVCGSWCLCTDTLVISPKCSLRELELICINGFRAQEYFCGTLGFGNYKVFLTNSDTCLLIQPEPVAKEVLYLLSNMKIDSSFDADNLRKDMEKLYPDVFFKVMKHKRDRKMISIRFNWWTGRRGIVVAQARIVKGALIVSNMNNEWQVDISKGPIK